MGAQSDDTHLPQRTRRFVRSYITMRKFLFALAAALIAAAALPEDIAAQVQITTKKVKIRDFTTKTTKVVLCGNDFLNTALSEEVSRRWIVSPFEFCTFEEYDKIKEDDKYYFLIPQTNKLRKETEPGITVLSLVKGGKPDDAIEIVSAPICSSKDSDGREIIYVSGVLNIIQNFAADAMVSDKVNLGGLSGYAKGTGKAKGKTIVISEGDLTGSAISAKSRYSKAIEFLPEDEADRIFEEETPNTIVGYVVAPAEPQKGSACYLYLISADTHELYMFVRYKLSAGGETGFRPADLKRIAGHHSN